MKNLFLGPLAAAVLLLWQPSAAQTRWMDPMQAGFPVVQGQGWNDELGGTYGRLPGRVRDGVRPALWGLSAHSAGLALHFVTNSPSVQVRYTVSAPTAMEHMPATGVSGADLYSVDPDGTWRYLSRAFAWRGDTVSYAFRPVAGDRYAELGWEYRLYLPLYARVGKLEIGVDSSARFAWIPQRTERPVVAYGTSILQGGCASRPGMAWTNILSRRLDRTVMNFGFSGNGQMDPELLALIGEIPARIYLVDCLPNLEYADDSLFRRKYIDGIRLLRLKSDAPILLVEHAGGTQNFANAAAAHKNRLLRECYEQLRTAGVRELYYLDADEIALPADGTVDGIHPTDLGMQFIAEAYERKIRDILREPTGTGSTTRAAVQRREAAGYDWYARHDDILERNRLSPPRVAMIGNSITHYWGGTGGKYPENGRGAWEKTMAPAGFRNMGCGNDRIENMLWRIYHGELDGYAAERVVLLAGVNNLLKGDSDRLIVDGILRLAEAVRDRQPEASIEVIGLLPCNGQQERIAGLNAQLDEALRAQGIASFRDVGAPLLQKRTGRIEAGLFLDGLHPNEKGYRKIAGTIADPGR